MSDLLREAEEELRREGVEKTVKKLAPVFGGAIVLALIIGAGLQFWNKKQAELAQTASSQYYEAMIKMQDGNVDAGIAALSEIAKNAPSGMAGLAALQQASALQEKGDSAGALAAFDQAVTKIKDKDLKNMARLRAAYIAAESEPEEKYVARLNQLTPNKNIIGLLARELKAANDWVHGRKDAAKSEYRLLELDPNSPKGLRARATQALAIIDAGATASRTLVQMPQNPNTPQAANPNAQNVETGPNGERIVRLPPGVKLPPNFKAPPNTRFIETPLPNGAVANQAELESARRAMDAEIEAERRRAMAEQSAITNAQQKQVNDLANAQAMFSAPQSTIGASQEQEAIEKLRDAPNNDGADTNNNAVGNN